MVIALSALRIEQAHAARLKTTKMFLSTPLPGMCQLTVSVPNGEHKNARARLSNACACSFAVVCVCVVSAVSPSQHDFWAALTIEQFWFSWEIRRQDLFSPLPLFFHVCFVAFLDLSCRFECFSDFGQNFFYSDFAHLLPAGSTQLSVKHGVTQCCQAFQFPVSKQLVREGQEGSK